MTTPPVPPAPAPTAPVASTAAPAASTAPMASTPTTPVAPPPPPAPPEPPEDDAPSGWPTWVTVLVTSTIAIVGTLIIFWLLGAFTISARIGEAVDPTPVVVVETVIVEATAAMPEATATTQPTKAPEATAQPTAAMPTATAAQPTKAAPKPTAPPAPTQVPPTAAPTQVPTAVPPAPAPTAYAYNSYASGSTVAPAGAVCWGDQITLDGSTYGDGTGPGNPVWTVLTKETSVSLIWGACTTGEGWETISARLKADPATTEKTFKKVP